MHKSFLVGIAVISSVILAIFISHDYYTHTEGDIKCYENFAATYTWPYARPMLDAMIADEVLTLNECDRILRLNQDAAHKHQRDSILQQVRGS